MCDYCNEHKTWIYLKDRYYNYGFCKRSYHTCGECYSGLFGPLRLVETFTMSRAYESIMQVIKDKTDGKKEEEEEENNVIDYYEAARIAYTESEHMQRYLDTTIKVVTEINKTFKPIWEFTYLFL